MTDSKEPGNCCRVILLESDSTKFIGESPKCRSAWHSPTQSYLEDFLGFFLAPQRAFLRLWRFSLRYATFRGGVIERAEGSSPQGNYHLTALDVPVHVPSGEGVELQTDLTEEFIMQMPPHMRIHGSLVLAPDPTGRKACKLLPVLSHTNRTLLEGLHVVEAAKEMVLRNQAHSMVYESNEAWERVLAQLLHHLRYILSQAFSGVEFGPLSRRLKLLGRTIP